MMLYCCIVIFNNLNTTIRMCVLLYSSGDASCFNGAILLNLIC